MSGEAENLSTNADENILDNTYGSAVSNASNHGSSSSKAVLAALRALQDKIRRLESERAQALDEATQLRHQLKNQEIEADHAKQREQLNAQKNLQEVRGAYERLLGEKTELEIRLTKLEEKNKVSSQGAEELQGKIRQLEEDKHSGSMKIRDLEHQRHQIETEIKMAKQKEEEMSESMVWESKRHEENVQANHKRIQTLQDELSELCQEKGMADAKLMELDQLVGQLLSVNESLVAQLSGKALHHHTVSGGSAMSTGGKKTTKKGKKVTVPRAASVSTVASQAGRVDKYTHRKHSQLIPVQMEEIEALRDMHKMYANVAKSIKKSISPSVGKTRGSKSSGGHRGNTSMGSASTGGGGGKLATRLSRKKAQLIDQFSEEAQHSLSNTSEIRPRSAPSGLYSGSSSSHSNNNIINNNIGIHQQGTPTITSADDAGLGTSTSKTTASREVRIPKPAVSFDQEPTPSSTAGNAGRGGGGGGVADRLDMSGDFEEFYNQRHTIQSLGISPVVPTTTSSHGGAGMSRSSIRGIHQDSPASVGLSTTATGGGGGGGGGVPSSSSQADMQMVIDSLEDEFAALNAQYRKLLSNVQSGDHVTGENGAATTGSGTADIAREPIVSTPESIQAQAEEIVSVIQQLHKKGEQLRQLKSSP